MANQRPDFVNGVLNALHGEDVTEAIQAYGEIEFQITGRVVRMSDGRLKTLIMQCAWKPTGGQG